MRLSFDQICEITVGAARVTRRDKDICFYRFTEGQENAYRLASPEDFYLKTFATAGIRLCFQTDSPYVKLQYRMVKASSRAFGWFDVYESGVLVAHFGGDTTGPMEAEETIALADGDKVVEIYFPWSAAGMIREMEVADGAYIKPVRKMRTMLAYGDSITQGYDAVYPSLSYMSRLSDMLDAACINKGIGGEKFFPALLDDAEALSPDLITVAYGTNDWSKRDPQSYEENCRGFLRKLTQAYPKAKIFVITPIWRADYDKQTPFGAPLSEAVRLIDRICGEFPGIQVIHAGTFTPHLRPFYSDGYLHPNDLGFGFYAQNLHQALETRLK